MPRQPAVMFTLSYGGKDADSQEIDLYDVSEALIGFQRSLALTTHLVLNGEIITQAPYLKGAQILARPAEEGSWKITAGIVVAGLTQIGTAPKDTPIGHLVFSAYDYVLSHSLGVHVDYNKTIGALYEESQRNGTKTPAIAEHNLDSLIEKCTKAVTDIHRPIARTGTATHAEIIASCGGEPEKLGVTLDIQTYRYIHESFHSDDTEEIVGRVSSYNSNTFKGRIYVAREGRPVAFELEESARGPASVKLIVDSLHASAMKNHESAWSTVRCVVKKITSRSGHLKAYRILEVSGVSTEQ